MQTNFSWLDLIEPTSKLDLTKDEDYNKVMDLVKDAKDTFGNFGIFGKGLFGDTFTKLIDTLEKRANEIHDEAKTKNPVRPSNSINENVQDNIKSLVNDYINTMVKPYATSNNLTEDQISKAADGLFEFACWMYSKK